MNKKSIRESDQAPFISMCQVTKKFGGVQACQNITFEIFESDVIGIAGERDERKAALAPHSRSTPRLKSLRGAASQITTPQVPRR